MVCEALGLFGETDGDGLELLVLLSCGDFRVRAPVGAGEFDVVGERREQGARVEPFEAHDVDLGTEDDGQGGEEDPCDQSEHEREGTVGVVVVGDDAIIGGSAEL